LRAPPPGPRTSSPCFGRRNSTRRNGRNCFARRARRILSISAHWFVLGTGVTISTSPRTIHDFGGFPPPSRSFQRRFLGISQMLKLKERLRFAEVGSVESLIPTRQAVGPLGRYLARTCLASDRSPGEPLGAQTCNSGRVHGNPGPSDPLALGPRISDTRTDPLGNRAALQFGRGSHGTQYQMFSVGNSRLPMARHHCRSLIIWTSAEVPFFGTDVQLS